MSETTPTVNKLQLAKLAKLVRAKAGLTQAQLGAIALPHLTAKQALNKIGFLENGQGGVDEDELKAILDACEVEEDLRVPMLRARAATSQRGRWSGFRAVYSEAFRKHVDLEEDASSIQVVWVEGIPDLLNDEPYARAMFAPYYPGSRQADELDAAVAARLARARALQQDRPDGKKPVKYHAVLSESCVRRVVGDSAVMRGTIGHMLQLSEQPNVTIQIVRNNAEFKGDDGALTRFLIFKVPVAGIESDLQFVYTNVANEPRYMDDKVALDAFEDMWTTVLGAAANPQESRRFLTEVYRALG
ncbi:helix-turn-helix domain-containing protein [Amycolatopsis sp. WGS_07]|uniref:helix-turn-helix domain-containing protein n=1 Tax=Amycolatopsis sp. WGS_07 TaxID=3076764 RepID=UPI00387341B2